MFGKSVKIDKNLYEKLKVAAQISKAASVDEFVIQTLSSEADRILSETAKGEISQDQIDDIANKLKGLGYLE
jgi:uncharacterized protein (DUF1778 family)